MAVKSFYVGILFVYDGLTESKSKEEIEFIKEEECFLELVQLLATGEDWFVFAFLLNGYFTNFIYWNEKISSSSIIISFSCFLKTYFLDYCNLFYFYLASSKFEDLFWKYVFFISPLRSESWNLLCTSIVLV